MGVAQTLLIFGMILALVPFWFLVKGSDETPEGVIYQGPNTLMRVYPDEKPVEASLPHDGEAWCVIVGPHEELFYYPSNDGNCNGL